MKDESRNSAQCAVVEAKMERGVLDGTASEIFDERQARRGSTSRRDSGQIYGLNL